VRRISGFKKSSAMRVDPMAALRYEKSFAQETAMVRKSDSWTFLAIAPE
jgi:hypothetical protein